MKNHLTLALIAAFAVTFAMTLVPGPALADGDGEKLFKRKCGSCHKMEKHGVGPMLEGVIGRKAGSTDFKKYKALKGADFTWDETNLDAWITDPKKFIGKKTAMSGKIKKAEDRAAIIEYLKSEAH